MSGTMPDIDWVKFWDDLVRRRERLRPAGKNDWDDRWTVRAEAYNARTEARWQTMDSSRAFLTGLLQSNPGATLLDIGAGCGKWTVPLAPLAAHVTAVEPSPAMRKHLCRHVGERRLSNVTVVEDPWPSKSVGAHDISLCAHSMYGVGDFAGWIRSVVDATRHTCVCILRAPSPDGVMAEASRHIFGHPFDSAGFQIAFNALIQLGIFPNVIMEDPRTWDPWVHESLAEALQELKRRLRLGDDASHDTYLVELLERRLKWDGSRFVWPGGTHAALIHWRVGGASS